MLNINRLNKRVTFYRNTNQGETDQYNRDIMSLIEYKSAWASLESLTGIEYLLAKKNVNDLKYEIDQKYKIYTRYSPELRDVNFIIGFKDQKFEIDSVININGKNEILLFMCTEKVGETIE